MFKTLKFLIVYLLLTLTFADKILMEGQLTIVRNNDEPSAQGTSLSNFLSILEIVPASFSSSV